MRIRVLGFLSTLLSLPSQTTRRKGESLRLLTQKEERGGVRPRDSARAIGGRKWGTKGTPLLPNPSRLRPASLTLKLRFLLSLNPIRRFGIFCCCLLLLGGCQSTSLPNAISIQVQRVVSGQTLDVLNPTQQPALVERVRLIGIEAPDLKQQPWGEAAKNGLEQIISKKAGQQLVIQPVLLEPDIQEKDTAGRWLAYVWQDGVLINEKLVEKGYVLAAPRSPNKKYDARLARAQEYARIMGYGIWSPARPMRSTPAEFRRRSP